MLKHKIQIKLSMLIHNMVHTVNIIALYFALFGKFCNGGLTRDFANRNM